MVSIIRKVEVKQMLNFKIVFEVFFLVHMMYLLSIWLYIYAYVGFDCLVSNNNIII